MSKYFDTSRIKGSELLSYALTYVQQKYNQYKESFTYASPNDVLLYKRCS